MPSFLEKLEELEEQSAEASVSDSSVGRRQIVGENVIAVGKVSETGKWFWEQRWNVARYYFYYLLIFAILSPENSGDSRAEGFVKNFFGTAYDNVETAWNVGQYVWPDSDQAESQKGAPDKASDTQRVLDIATHLEEEARMVSNSEMRMSELRAAIIDAEQRYQEYRQPNKPVSGSLSSEKFDVLSDVAGKVQDFGSGSLHEAQEVVTQVYNALSPDTEEETGRANLAVVGAGLGGLLLALKKWISFAPRFGYKMGWRDDPDAPIKARTKTRAKKS